jgi:hypothetical protein
MAALTGRSRNVSTFHSVREEVSVQSSAPNFKFNAYAVYSTTYMNDAHTPEPAFIPTAGWAGRVKSAILTGGTRMIMTWQS